MSGVDRFDVLMQLTDAKATTAECVLASDYDTLRTANQRLETELASMKEDRDQQYDMKVKARKQRDAVTATNKRIEGEVARLREALTEIRKTSIVHRYAKLQALAMREVAVSALSTANGEVTE